MVPVGLPQYLEVSSYITFLAASATDWRDAPEKTKRGPPLPPHFASARSHFRQAVSSASRRARRNARKLEHGKRNWLRQSSQASKPKLPCQALFGLGRLQLPQTQGATSLMLMKLRSNAFLSRHSPVRPPPWFQHPRHGSPSARMTRLETHGAATSPSYCTVSSARQAHSPLLQVTDTVTDTATPVLDATRPPAANIVVLPDKTQNRLRAKPVYITRKNGGHCTSPR